MDSEEAIVSPGQIIVWVSVPIVIVLAYKTTITIIEIVSGWRRG